MPDSCLTCVEGEGAMEWNGTLFRTAPRATVSFFGEVSSVSFASYVISISSIVQVVVFITIGAWGDYGTLRWKCLAIFTGVACRSGVKVASTLPEDSAPSARLAAPRAQPAAY